MLFCPLHPVPDGRFFAPRRPSSAFYLKTRIISGMFEQHPSRSHGFQNHFATCRVRDAFSFFRSSAPPGVAGCGRVRPDSSACGRIFSDGLQHATPNIAFACRNAENRPCVSSDGVPGGSLNRASPTAARHGGQGGAKHDSQIMRPYPLPFAAPRAMAAEGCV